MRDPSLQALLRELAAFNRGLCVITTRLLVADLVEHEGSSALRLDLEHLSSEAGTQLLRTLGVKGPEAELHRASDDFERYEERWPCAELYRLWGMFLATLGADQAGIAPIPRSR